MREWSSLRQTRTAEEYMKKVDELATVMPLGEVAEYNHALQGMRPEIRAEIEFRMQEIDNQHCSREELWRLMWLAETRFPPPVSRPFISRFKPKAFTAKVTSPASTSTSTIICWVCDAVGHRASACPRKRMVGCSRCGSRAHGLLSCPQRVERGMTRRPEPRPPPKKGGKAPTK